MESDNYLLTKEETKTEYSGRKWRENSKESLRKLSRSICIKQAVDIDKNEVRINKKMTHEDSINIKWMSKFMSDC